MLVMFFRSHLPKKNVIFGRLVIIQQLIVIGVESIPFIFVHIPVLGNSNVNARL
jgi:hypothetical protein